MDIKRSSRRVLLAAAVLLASADAAEAQRVVAGFTRINQSDVTGPAVTSGDQLSFEFGRVQSVSCAAAWGLRTEARALGQDLSALTLRAVGEAERVLWEGAQRDLAALLAGGPGARAAGRRVRDVLTPASNRSVGARRAAGALVGRLEGLLGEVERMDPRDPGRGAPTRLYASVGAWDDFVDASSDAFLAAPTQDMLAIQAVLGRLTHAAIQHAARDGDTEVVDAFGLACAPASVAPVADVVEPPAAEPVAELPFEVCVLSGGDFRSVWGIHLPLTGDSLVDAGGVRRPLREAYPDLDGYAAGMPWFARELAITAGGAEYRQWGTPRVARPGELERRGEYLGVPVFAEPEGPALPDVIYLPSRAGCQVQPYRRAAEIHRVRG